MISKQREKYNNLGNTKIFKKYLKELDSIDTQNWFSYITNILASIENIYSKENTRYKTISQLLNYNEINSNLVRAKNEIKYSLESIIYELKNTGIPIYKTQTAINKIVSPTISNAIDINVASNIEANLPPNLINEIKTILDSKNEDSKNKQNKIAKALKEMGENILSKTLAALIMSYFSK